MSIPQNKEVEQAILGCCLIDDTFEKISSLVKKEDFYFEDHQTIWQSFGVLSDEGVAIDIVTLSEKVKDLNLMDLVIHLSDKVQTSTQVNHYIKILLEKSKLRAMRREYMQALDRIELDANPEQIQEKIDKELESFKPIEKEETHIKNSLEEIKGEYEAISKGEYNPTYIKTHISHLDDKIRLEKGCVFTIAAPTSVGKSALSLNIALRSAYKDQIPTLIFSLEMPQKQLSKRMLSALSKTNLKRIEESVATPEMLSNVDKAIDKLNDLPIHSIHSIKNVNQLARDVRRYKKEHKIELVVIDYLQLIPFNAGRMGKADGIAMISQKIKQIALDNDVAIVLLSQLNREGARSEYPDLYHLKDSGSIENDADIVLIMNCKDNDTESSKAVDDFGSYMSINYLIAKNREGERGVRGSFKFYAMYGIFK